MRYATGWYLNGVDYQDPKDRGYAATDDPSDAIQQELGFCNCGCPETTQDWIMKGLEIINERHGGGPGWDEWYAQHKEKVKEHFGNDGAYYFFQYWLDKEGFTEHGGNVGNAWLDASGELLLTKLRFSHDSR